LESFSNLLNVAFDAAEEGAQFIFGRNSFMVAAAPKSGICPALPRGLGNITSGLCAVRVTTMFALSTFPAVIFFSGLMALLENLGVIGVIVNFFGWLFERTMKLSGAEALSGSANIFVGIEAAIVVKPYLPTMTRSELCAILACCFGTAASSVLAIYVRALEAVLSNILGHLVSASIMAIPACFVLSKILVPETTVPETMGGLSKVAKQDANSQDNDDNELKSAGGEVMKRVSPMDAAILGALDGVKMSASIAAVLILIVGLVYLLNQTFGWLAGLPSPIGGVFKVVTLANIQGFLFYPLTLLTGISADESWQASVIIGRRLLETAIPPYNELGRAALAGELSSRTVIIVSYALSGFAHLASVGIFVGGTIALIPSRRRDISELGWKALFVGTLATLMIACIAGVFDNGNPSILGDKKKAEPVQIKPSATTSPSALPSISPSVSPTSSPAPIATPSVSPTTSPAPTTTPKTSPSLPASR
ncbi:MAG: NupC/NupG family nucleoside CNT transporter, partial [Pseudanabaena sp.]